MDVGGSNTRARIVRYDGENILPADIIASHSAALSEKPAFLEFVKSFLDAFKAGNRLDAAVLSFAGPVSGHAGVVMTNWREPRSLDLAELATCGLPADHTLFLNDMEAAAYRIVAAREHAGPAVNTLNLYDTTDTESADNNNAILIMPGTGVGIASIVASLHDHAAPLVVPCEVQHAAIPALDEQHAGMIREMAEMLHKVHPSWEDFISGRGLENMYRVISRQQQGQGSSEGYRDITADRIAELAIVDEDLASRDALHLYYRCAGALAQLMALTLRPCGGIYLAGSSTRNNYTFISRSDFLTELQNNSMQKQLLKRFPVYVVIDELNLDGATWIGGCYLRDDPHFHALFHR